MKKYLNANIAIKWFVRIKGKKTNENWKVLEVTVIHIKFLQNDNDFVNVHWKFVRRRTLILCFKRKEIKKFCQANFMKR